MTARREGEVSGLQRLLDDTIARLRLPDTDLQVGAGPLSSAEITERLGIGRRSTLNRLSRMETEGVVERTEAKLTSRPNRWRMTARRGR